MKRFVRDEAWRRPFPANMPVPVGYSPVVFWHWRAAMRNARMCATIFHERYRVFGVNHPQYGWAWQVERIRPDAMTVVYDTNERAGENE